MAQIECGRGHLYDPDKYPTCPYCNTNQQITVAAAGRTAPIRVTGTNRTAPVSVTAPQRTAPLSGVSVTAPQKTAPLSGISVTAPSKTMPPRGYNPNGAPVQPEEAPAPAFPHGASVTSAGKTVGMMQETTPSGAASTPSAAATAWTSPSPATGPSPQRTTPGSVTAIRTTASICSPGTGGTSSISTEKRCSPPCP